MSSSVANIVYFGIEKVIFRVFTTHDLIVHIIDSPYRPKLFQVRSGQVEMGCRYFSMNSATYADS